MIDTLVGVEFVNTDNKNKEDTNMSDSKHKDPLILPTSRVEALENQIRFQPPRYILTGTDDISKEQLIETVVKSDIADEPLKNFLGFDVQDGNNKQLKSLKSIYDDICDGKPQNQYAAKMVFIRILISMKKSNSNALLEMIAGSFVPVVYSSYKSAYDVFIEREDSQLYITSMPNYGRYYLNGELISDNCSCCVMKANGNMIFTICTENVNKNATRVTIYKILFAKKICESDLIRLAPLFEAIGLKQKKSNGNDSLDNMIKTTSLW